MSARNTEEERHSALMNFLSKLGLERFYPNKLTTQELLEINKTSLQEETVSSLKEMPWCFLRSLFKVNTKCRNCTQVSTSHEENDELYEFDLYTEGESSDKMVNLLDLIVALFLCADSLLQQKMTLKMAMCQFSVPLLLPHSKNSQSSLMLWGLRDIVKEWCPHNLSETRGFVENNIVQADIPFYSFVRLKNCSLSKSLCLNEILSRGQQNQNIFVHREMEEGAIEREISNGLVEVCWYLPCGRKNLDVFPKPVAFANLRGDICESLSQFNFLFQVSNATFVFLDKIEKKERDVLKSLPDVRNKLFLVVNSKDWGASNKDIKFVKATLEELDLPKTSVKSKDPKVNAAIFSKKLCATINTSLSEVKATSSVVNMFVKAIELGLHVDESITDQEKTAAEEIMKLTMKQEISLYKKQQLPLQGESWKRLSKLQKEYCRLNSCGDSSLEDYKCQLQEDQRKIQEEQSHHQLSEGMKIFIKNISTKDKEKRNVFLKWMKLKLDTFSREKLSALRKKYKEGCKKKDTKCIQEMDQALLESSLGIEHYLRETGLIYEFSLHSEEFSDVISRLPSLAAEMLLDGYPLELLDGDASNIPEKWITEVLMELHKKVGGDSRLLVLTVLGVQSSGKSTLLNTMFGVQFPVSSGRCTRGAFMLFLKVAEDLKSELKCDFIVLIDTEGLKSPDMVQHDDSYEHDNQLATFVIGLSDITIVNVAMENSTEMKDILQIAAHAFLRMKHIGKKPVCHFVHQNVAGVSAHSKCITERQHLLDQLNETTQIAAEMEKQSSFKTFTDLLDYDVEKNNWNIPGLWHGTPPMAPVNIGYSEVVADFKITLLKTLKERQSYESHRIPEFLEWMKNLWKAVKYENFIFSFRNTLVAHAYDNLCKEYNQWEWEFRKEILSWQEKAKLELSNIDNESPVDTWSRLVEDKKTEVSIEIKQQQSAMEIKLSEYYKRKERHVILIEKYKADFFNSIRSLATEIQRSVITALDYTHELKVNKKKAQEVLRQYRLKKEEHIMDLLKTCKGLMSDEELKSDFEKMWDRITADVCSLKEEDIAESILKQLRSSFSNRNVTEDLQNIDLKETGTDSFWVSRDHVDASEDNPETDGEDLQSVADNIIESCSRFVRDKVKTSEDYHELFTKELLQKIEDSLQRNRKLYKTKFEIDLKLHICGFALREFLKVHKQFLSDNDPKTQLEKHKDQYLSDFFDLYKNRDHSQRKANDFIKFCIKPAVEEYINRSLGIDIVDEILTSSHSAEYSSRYIFHYNIQKELLEEGDFNSFVKYIGNYEIFVKEWIFQHTQKKLLEDNTLCKLKTKNLQIILQKITEATDRASIGDDGVLLPDETESIKEFIGNIRKHLIKDISVSVEAENTTLFQIQSTCHPFIKCFRMALQDLEEQLQDEFSNFENILETLNKLPVKPQDELFKRVFGCGQQCPFCKIPCEAGGKKHKQHHAAVHRPQGLTEHRYHDTGKLAETLCTTDVHSSIRSFKNKDTKMKFHPYKDYTKYYPDWLIPPDYSIEASDYWKYVMVKYNRRFAEEYRAQPADVPEAWRRITKEQALKGLETAFNMK